MKKIITCIVVVAACLSSGFVIADCDKQPAGNAADSRFVLNKGEAFDKETKLTWHRCSAGAAWKEGAGCVGTPELMCLEEARSFAKQAGNGWRVPTIKELYSIAEQECENTAINSIVFPDIRDFGEGAAPYWSVTRVENMPMLVYYVDFIHGQVDGHSDGFIMAVRLVRSQQ